MKLVLVKSGVCELAEENKYAGWTDSPLSHTGVKKAIKLGKEIKTLSIDFGIAYTSVLTRAKDTLKYIKEETNTNLKTRESYKLNARHLGVLEEKNKNEVQYMYGEEKIESWFKTFDKKPPELVITDKRFPGNDPKYKDILKFELPLSESLQDAYDRVIDYFENEISTFLKIGENVLMIAHESTMRVITKYLEELNEEDTGKLEFINGQIIIYDLDDNLKMLNKRIIR